VNSSLTGGRSIGKRTVGMRVMGREGFPISLGRSILRATAAFLPPIVFGTDFRFVADAAEVPGATLAYSLILVGMGGAAFYLVFAMMWSGRTLHDLVAGTFVLHRDAVPADAQPLWRIDMSVIAAFLGISLVIPFVPLSWFETWEPARTVAFAVELQRALATDKSFVLRGYESDVRSSYSGSNGWVTTSLLRVGVHGYGSNPDLDAAMKKTVLKLIDTNPDLMSYTYLSAVATRGFTFGMTPSPDIRACYGTPQQWREKAGECPVEGSISFRDSDN